MLLNLYNIVVNYVRINSIYFGKSCTVYSMYNAHFEFRVSLKSRNEAIRGCILDEEALLLLQFFTHIFDFLILT